MNRSNRFAITASLLVLAACGGGGGGGDATVPPPATDSVPDSASASVPAMKGWLSQLSATAPEDREALDAARFAPPQPDDAEPEPLS